MSRNKYKGNRWTSVEWNHAMKNQTVIDVLRIDCTFFKFKATKDSETNLIWTMNRMLGKIIKFAFLLSTCNFIISVEPSVTVQTKAAKVLEMLKQNSHKMTIALHIRAEQDWIDHCKNWESIRDGILRDNCYTNTEKLDITLLTAGIPMGSTIYVAGAYAKKSAQLTVMDKLNTMFRVVTKELVLGEIETLEMQENREVYAAIDYEVCNGVDIFIGNSVSTFAGLLLLSRERDRILGIRPHIRQFHYNTGGIPLTDFLPLDVPHMTQIALPLKWVFCYSSYVREYDDMLKAAVMSAITRTKLMPVCVFYGNENDIYIWLVAHGVLVIKHKPSWAYQIMQASKAMKANVGASHLYKNPHMMIATFMRIDIPIIGFSDTYVLYTDIDVFFQRDVSFSDFEALPTYFVVGVEGAKDARCRESLPYGNAGVMLMNLVNLRRSRKDFLMFIFSRESISKGINFEGYGPGDQGAYHYFYREKFNVVASPLFNWKAYWEFNPNASIVHFHGPKPTHFQTYIESNTTGYSLFDPIMSGCWSHGGCERHLQLFNSFLKRDVKFTSINLTHYPSHQIPKVRESVLVNQVCNYCKSQL